MARALIPSTREEHGNIWEPDRQNNLLKKDEVGGLTFFYFETC
jgi:hypothetical protein